MRVHRGHLPGQRVATGSQRTPETDDYSLLVGRIVDEFPGWDHSPGVIHEMHVRKGRDHALGIIKPDFAHRAAHGHSDTRNPVIEERMREGGWRGKRGS